ncbi:MAG: ferredoxin family protein, partial [Chloroflexota bacterium]
SLCLRDAGCIEVCPVECIVPGMPDDKYPLYYIDPETCIDCGACIPECPYESIFTEDEVPDAYEATGGEYLAGIVGTAGFDTEFVGTNHHGVEVKMATTRILDAGEVIDLTPDTPANYDYFENGPAYWEGWEEHAH